MDFAGPFLGHRFLIVVDAHSKWIEAFTMPTITSSATIEKLRVLFAQFGLPDVIVTDNGSNFTSSEFDTFCQRNGIKHITSAPFHPSTNGLAERAVQTVKRGILKLKEGSLTDKLSRFLFSYRNTPLQLTGSTPAELFLGRRVKSALDQIKPDLSRRVEQRQLVSKCYHDKKVKRPNFQVGDAVLARNYGSGPK
jgi:transposase InsO family protein